MNKYIVILCVTIISCNSENTQEPVIEQIVDTKFPAVIQYGRTLTSVTMGFTVGFRSVHEDSRCPILLVCFWEGTARITVWIKPVAADTIFIDSSIPGYVWEKDTARHSRKDTLEYSLTLMQLDPYPHKDSVYSHIKYSALINITKQ